MQIKKEIFPQICKNFENLVILKLYLRETLSENSKLIMIFCDVVKGNVVNIYIKSMRTLCNQ